MCLFIEHPTRELQLDHLLPIEALLEALGDQPVDEHGLRLAVPVGAEDSLRVIRRVPRGIEDDHA